MSITSELLDKMIEAKLTQLRETWIMVPGKPMPNFLAKDIVFNCVEVRQLMESLDAEFTQVATLVRDLEERSQMMGRALDQQYAAIESHHHCSSGTLSFWW